tara:strand:+ start:563 stop:742 length:180 start_codon:yes stop_codon:yes gene_type:complete
MKKTIILVAIVFALASCSTNAPETTPVITDSTAVADSCHAACDSSVVGASSIAVVDSTK